MKHRLQKYIACLNSRGDTIVEVMMALAVLSIILATAYATSTRSLQTGLNSQYRNQAVAYVQSQLEIIKNADNSTGQSQPISTYEVTNNPFCIDPSNGDLVNADPNTGVCPEPIGAAPANQDGFNVADVYDSTQKTFTITVSWTGANNQQEQTVTYYKPHDSFVTTANSYNPCDQTHNLCFNYQTLPPAAVISLTATPSPSVTYNGTVTLKYSASNITGTTCTASANPANAAWTGAIPVSTTQRTKAVTHLTTDTTFTLTCKDLTNSDASTQVTEPITAASITKFTATAKVAYNGNTTLAWTTASGTSPGCVAGGASPANSQWTNQALAANGSLVIKNLLADTTFTLICNSYAGHSPATATATTTISPPALAPSTITTNATPIGSSKTSENINGLVNPNGYATIYQFDWGTTSSYGKVAPAKPVSLGAGTNQLKVTQSLTGLTQGTTYHYRVCASNIVGSNCGNDMSFTK